MTSPVDYLMGASGTGQPSVVYPRLSFKPEAFFLMGSPIGKMITSIDLLLFILQEVIITGRVYYKTNRCIALYQLLEEIHKSHEENKRFVFRFGRYV